ncbi:hypothetical protein IAE56_15250 [Stenotrophomonas sp. S41]|nr:hypothetical protein [Stenotrophomonas sp. S41]
MRRLFLLLSCLLPAPGVLAEDGHRSNWIWNGASSGHHGVGWGADGVMLSPGALGAFVDTRVHMIGNRRFRALYQVFDSNPENRMGRCGAGREVHLHVYELTPTRPVERGAVLVSSCLQTLALASQDSGAPDSESDFSSVIWTKDGFTVEWWGDGPEGRATSHYALRNGQFGPAQP